MLVQLRRCRIGTRIRASEFDWPSHYAAIRYLWMLNPRERAYGSDYWQRADKVPHG